METFSLEQIGIFAIFAVPGFVAIKVFALLVPSESRVFNALILEALTFSLINYGIWFWLIARMERLNYQEEHPVQFVLCAFLVLFVSPAFITWSYYRLRSSRFLQGRLRHPDPTAWDYCFRDLEPGWVIIHLKTGIRIGGFFGEQSFASSFPHNEDLYLEELWQIDSEGKFTSRVPQTSGAIIRREDCLGIEFFRINHDDRESKQEANSSGSDSGGLPAQTEGLPTEADLQT